MDYAELEKLVDLVAHSGVTEVTLQAGVRRITIRQPAHAVAPEHHGLEEQAGAAIASITPSPPPGDGLPAAYTVIAPMVGVFHPADPAVHAGTRVEIGHVVGIIESMKLMNDIRAERAGMVRAALVEPGMAVEYGQPIFEMEAE